MERIKVLVRIRPFLQNENSSGTGLNIDSDSTQKIEISIRSNLRPSFIPKKYSKRCI